MKENSYNIDKVDSVEASVPETAKASIPEAVEACEPKAVETNVPEAANASMPEMAKTSEPKNAETSKPKIVETNDLEIANTNEVKITEAKEATISEAVEAQTDTAGSEAEKADNIDTGDTVIGIDDTGIDTSETDTDGIESSEADNAGADNTDGKKLSTRQKATIAGAIGIVVLIGAFVALVVSGAFLSPADRFQRIQRAAIFNPIIESINEQDNYLSTDISISMGLENAPHSMEMFMLQNLLGAANIDINMDITPSRAIYRYGVNILNSDLISLTYVVDFEEYYFGFYVPELDSNYYIMDWDTFYSLQGMEGLFEDDGSYFFTPEALSALVENQADIILSMVNNSNIEESRETITLFDGTKEVRGTLYTFTPSQEDIYDMLNAFVQEIRENELYFLFFTMAGGSDYVRQGYDSPEHYFDSMLADLEGMLCSISEAISDSNFTWRTAISGRQLLMQEISFTPPDSGEFLLRYEGHSSGGDRTDWFTIRGTYELLFFTNEFEVSLQNDMNLDGNNAVGVAKLYFQNVPGDALAFFDDYYDFLPDSFIANFGGDGVKRELFNVEYDLDLATRSILEIPYGTIQTHIFDMGGATLFNLLVTVEENDNGGTNHTLLIPSIEGLDGMGVSINMHSTDEPSDIQAPIHSPVDLSGYTMDEIDPILSNMTQQIQNILFDLILGNMF